jgi:hypothetical protein
MLTLNTELASNIVLTSGLHRNPSESEDQMFHAIMYQF